MVVYRFMQAKGPKPNNIDDGLGHVIVILTLGHCTVGIVRGSYRNGLLSRCFSVAHLVTIYTEFGVSGCAMNDSALAIPYAVQAGLGSTQYMV